MCTKDNGKSIIQTALTKGEIKLYSELKTRRALCKLGTVRALDWSAFSVYINNKNCNSNVYENKCGRHVAAWVKHSTRDGHIKPHTQTPSFRQKAQMPTTCHTSIRCQQQTCRHAPTNANCRSSPLPFDTGAKRLVLAFSGVAVQENAGGTAATQWPRMTQYRKWANFGSPRGATRHKEKQRYTLARGIVAKVRGLKNISYVRNTTFCGNSKCARVWNWLRQLIVKPN